MSISLKTIALLAPSFVTLFWAMILFVRNHSTRNPGFYIACQMLAFFIVFSSIIPFYTGNIRLYILMEPAFFLAVCMIFPLTWLYVRTVTCRTGLTRTDLLHFFPAVFTALSAIACQFIIPPEHLSHYGSGQPWPREGTVTAQLPYLVNYFSKGIIVLQIPCYFALSEGLIRKHRKQVDDYFSGLKQYYFNWIRIFYITYPGASVLGLFLLLEGNSNLDNTAEPILVLVFFVLSGIFFLIAYIANHQRYIENGEFYRTIPVEGKIPTNVPHVPEGLKTALEQMFEEERPYLQHELKITDIASQLGTNRTYVSQLIRTHYGTNFSGFVNAFRTREAISMFGQEAYRNHTTKSIAEAAGFNNYNSFTGAFRKETGMTPGQYRDKNMISATN